MPRYRFVKKYRSDRGQWSAGDEVDLTEAEADWFNRDVVDCLEPVTPKVEDPEPEEDEDSDPDDETRAIDAPPSDRQVKRPERTRRAPIEQPIDKSTFKAVKD